MFWLVPMAKFTISVLARSRIIVEPENTVGYSEYTVLTGSLAATWAAKGSTEVSIIGVRAPMSTLVEQQLNR